MKRAWILALLAACHQKQPPTSTQNPSPRTEEGLLAFQAPADWTSQPPANKLRKAQYAVPDKEKRAGPAEFTYSYFGSAGGATIEENVRRWAEQVGASAEDANVEKAQGAHPVTLVTCESGGRRLLAAAVEAPNGQHFFKLVGPDATVAGWAPEFRALALKAK